MSHSPQEGLLYITAEKVKHEFIIDFMAKYVEK